ncbi:hypothetical protein WR25_12192 [Diploscapter pachys]|uniref:Eukaryotic translation initiation factor 3 subunit B n=1 Tax=Diploscapter pachys TaxID=2018661 RepID=A0A2A2LWP6_9BILA|nr:hypothetical protein WR25_12192 [Diploscapter pachys]
MVEVDLNKENEEEQSFSDPEDFVDEVSDEELVPDILAQEPRLADLENNCVVIFGIPVVGSDRLSKLTTVLGKVFDKVGGNYKLHVPQNAEGGSLGMALLYFDERESAERCAASLDSFAFDKNHTFSVVSFKEAKLLDAPDPKWQPPPKEPYNDVGDVWWWMQNPRCLDQFAVLCERHVDGGNSHNATFRSVLSVYWHKKNNEPELAGDAHNCERPDWTTDMFMWSPHGSYLATMFQQGVALWAGPKFQRVQKFAHQDVIWFEFSKAETYLVTYAPPTNMKTWWECEHDCLRIWDVRTGELKSVFSPLQLCGQKKLNMWPFFKWSSDEKYFACLKPPEKDKLDRNKKVDGIWIFETETFKLSQGTSVPFENIRQIEWSPTSPIIAYYCECADQTPAEFGLLEMPSRIKLRTGRVYNVSDAQMFWQPSGKRLCVYTQRYKKKDKTRDGEIKYVGGTQGHLEIFEMDKKEISLMNLPLPEKEPFIHFGWEPNGDKFCVLTGNQSKAMPHVYRIDHNTHAPKLMSKLDSGVQYNEVSWSPSGQWLAILASRSTGGNVMFVDTTTSEAKRTNVVEHPGFTQSYWDPTGRYFTTCCTLRGRHSADLGYRVYTFQREDDEEKNKASQEVIEKRRKIMNAFEVIRKRIFAEINTQQDSKIQLRGKKALEVETKEEDLVEETITVALSTEKTAVAADEE